MSDDEDNKIGVITEVNGKDISEVDKSDRREWAEKLCKKLENLNGVVSAFIDDHTTNTFFLAVELESNERGRGYIIKPELRVLGKKIKKIVDEDKYASANIVANDIQPPEKINSKHHKSKYYFIEVNYP